MAYTITLNGYGDFTEWQEVNLKTPEMYFATEQEAEETARDMDTQAWEAWDKNHPDADEEEKLSAADHAPAFEVTETEISDLDGTARIQYEELGYKEIEVKFDESKLRTYLQVWVAFEQVDGKWKNVSRTADSSVGRICCGNGDVFCTFSLDDQEAIESAAIRIARAKLNSIKVQNINSAFGDAVCFDNVDEMAEAIKDCGYELPADGLVEGRDYREV